MVIRVRPGYHEVDVLILDETLDEPHVLVRAIDGDQATTEWVPLGRLVADRSYREIRDAAQEYRS